MLTGDELKRYDRQIMIPGIGEKGQEKLKRARVVIAGGEGLGSPASIYLAAAGVGTIRIIDHDRVERPVWDVSIEDLSLRRNSR